MPPWTEAAAFETVAAAAVVGGLAAEGLAVLGLALLTAGEAARLEYGLLLQQPI